MAISQGFRQNQRLEYDPKGGDFLQEQRLTLLAKPLPYLCGDKRRLCRVRRVKVKRSTGRETEGSASGTLTALPGLGIPKTGRPPRQRMCLYMCCPCTGAKTTNREATPSYLFTRKIRGSRRPIPCHSHRIWQDAASRGFFAPPHPLRQLPRSQRLGNDPSLRLSFR